MRVLLDTCVLSEIQRPDGNPAVKNAVSKLNEDDIFISILSIGEIAKGISLLEKGKRKSGLLSWLNRLENDYRDRILDI